MAAIKTCEEYVLRELENTQRENELLKTEKQKLEEQNAEVIKENEKLKGFMKLMARKAKPDFDYNYPIDNSFYVTLYLHYWREGEKELLDELQKYKEEDNE